MKNIHLLPTDKPSRLVKLKMFGKDKLHSCKVLLPIENEEQYQNIYITSDEEIKDGDYYITILDNEVFKADIKELPLTDKAMRSAFLKLRNNLINNNENGTRK